LGIVIQINTEQFADSSSVNKNVSTGGRHYLAVKYQRSEGTLRLPAAKIVIPYLSKSLPHDTKFSMAEAIVELRGANIRQGDQNILKKVDLRIVPGEFVYLVGKTGAGKSSLLKALYAALPLAGGSGTVAGFPLANLNRRNIPKLRRKLGIVFQDFNLLMDRSVEDNLRFALEATGWQKGKDAEERIEKVLASVGLADRRTSMPHTLSGGERQRVAFSRALLNHPVLLIADEVTGNLDPETSREILELMRRLAAEENAAVVFATHDYSLLETFQARVVRCEGGKVFNSEH
jgi:cell division transport system ATP-binding protein